MKCPRCETSVLDECERDGVTIDACQRCRGIWLDRGEIERLIARAVEEEDVSARRGGYDHDGDDDDHDHVDRRMGREGRQDHEDRGYSGGRGRKLRWYESLTNIFDNCRTPPRTYERAEILVGMCMDNRKVLRLPENFAYVQRAGGANLRRVEFKVSFAVAIGGVRAICLAGHEECGVVNLQARREEFDVGLVKNSGWIREAAEEVSGLGLVVNDGRPSSMRVAIPTIPASLRGDGSHPGCALDVLPTSHQHRWRLVSKASSEIAPL